MKFVHVRYDKYSSWFDYLGKYINGHIGIEGRPSNKYGIKEHISVTESRSMLFGLKTMNPDVIFIQNAISYDYDFIKRLKQLIPRAKLIGHHNAPYKASHLKAFKEYDLMYVGMMSMKQSFSRAGINAKILLNAFEPVQGLRDVPLISQLLFNGSIFLKPGFHYNRLMYIEELLKTDIPMTLSAVLDSNSPLSMIKRAVMGQPVYCSYSRRLRKENTRAAWDNMRWSEVYIKQIKSHPVVFNCHADIATEATNMRMFEVCGIGSLLITDHKWNISNLFEPNKEILTYKNVDELILKVKWALNNPHEARKIAKAGQARVMRDHTVKQRAEIIKKEL